MAIGNIYVLHGVQTPDNFYANVRDVTPSTVMDLMQEFAAGYPQPLFTAVRGIAPEIVIETPMVGTAITEFGLFGKNHTAGNVDLYYKKVASQGVREADASLVHVRLRMQNAFGYIQQITAGHQQEAMARIRIVSPWDGVNEPIVPAGSLALAGTPAAAEFYGLGPVDINNTAVNGIRDLTVDLKAEVMELGDASELFHSFVAIRSVAPVITGRCLEQLWPTYTLDGTALVDDVNGDGIELYLRRKASDGGNVANATANHVKLTGRQGLVTVESTAGGGNDEALTNFRVTLRQETALVNDVLTMAASVAIT